MPRAGLIIFILLASFSLGTTAQPRESIEGIHYQALPTPVPTETSEDVIEVREMFWYGCPECFTLEPMTTAYRDGVRGDVKMLRTPAIWNDLMAMHARIYYTGQLLKQEDRIHQAAFHAIHEEGLPLRTEDQVRDFFNSQGISADAFNRAWHDETVNRAIEQARLRTLDYQLDKLPTMIVGGRYKVTENAKVFDHVELNIAVNMVIRRLRDERRSDF